MHALWFVFFFVAAYLVGAIPFGYLFTRVACGKDIRDFGSHNVGAINVFRVAGVRPGMATLLADITKGAGIVFLAAALTASAWLIAMAAFLVPFGHAYSIYFYLQDRHFSEGKSVASGIGVLIGLTWIGALPTWIVGLTVGIWLGGLLLPRLLTGHWASISIATMTATGVVPFLVWTAHPAPAYCFLTIALAALVLLRHKNNLRRLRNGIEPRLGEPLPRGSSV